MNKMTNQLTLTDDIEAKLSACFYIGYLLDVSAIEIAHRLRSKPGLVEKMKELLKENDKCN